MPSQVVIIHGWSDTSKSFMALREFLTTNGFDARQIWLGDYISMEDDVRVEDAARRLEDVVKAMIASNDLKPPFDLIVHSTGGLVAREWISRYYPRAAGCPVKRVLMLAPANFGSRLASLGKSMIGRIAKGWNNWFQTGEAMLSGLELASAYQWDLARRDLFDAGGSAEGPYGRGKVWPFVIVGTRPYSDGLRQIVNEYGSDGTVRCAAANLNAVGLTIDFSQDGANPTVTGWPWRAGNVGFPFAILPDRNHSSVHEPEDVSSPDRTSSDRLGKLILTALQCASDDQYASIFEEWNRLNEETNRLGRDSQGRTLVFGKDAPPEEAFHQFMQIVTHVRDDQGNPVPDYFLEFFSPETRGDADAIYFHGKVLDDVHVNAADASRRCLFVDRTDLMTGYYPLIPDPAKRNVALSISAAEIGPNIRYFDRTRSGAVGHLVVHSESEELREALGAARLRRNTTHLVEIIIPRQPIDRVFALSR